MFVPPGVVTNERMSRLMDTSDEWIRQRTGIEERRYARRGDLLLGSSALEAARAAIADAGLEAGDLDFIVFATMTPDHYFPGNGGLLAPSSASRSTHALDIRMQCAGFLSGLQVADAFIRSGTYRGSCSSERSATPPSIPGAMQSGPSCSATPRGRSPRRPSPGGRRNATARSSSGTARAPSSWRQTRPATGADSWASKCGRTGSTGTSSTSPGAVRRASPTSHRRCSPTTGPSRSSRGARSSGWPRPPCREIVREVLARSTALG